MLPRSRGGAEEKTIERRGRREKEQPKVGPKGELSGSERVNGVAQGGQPQRSGEHPRDSARSWGKPDWFCSRVPASTTGYLLSRRKLELAFCACPSSHQIRG